MAAFWKRDGEVGVRTEDRTEGGMELRKEK